MRGRPAGLAGVAGAELGQEPVPRVVAPVGQHVGAAAPGGDAVGGLDPTASTR